VPNLGLTTASVGTLANKIIEGRKFMVRRILLITASVAAVAAVQCAPARAQNCSVGSLPCVYSVKFICGDQPANPNLHLPSEPPVKPGNYATAVNIHNFHQSQKAIILKRAVIANPENQPPGQTRSAKSPSARVRRLRSTAPTSSLCSDLCRLRYHRSSRVS